MRLKKYDIRLTPNFSLSEFIVSETADKKKFKEQFYVDFIITENLQNLCVNVLQPLRNVCGKVIILSGYRCQRLNNAVKGSDHSQHLIGCAADFRVPDLKRAVDYISAIEFDQMIIYQNFIHVSYTPKRLRKQIIYK